MRSIRFIPALALVLTSAACSKENRNEAGGDVAPGAGTATATASAVRVTVVEVGRAVGADKRVTDKTDDFKASETVYASVLTTGTGANTTLMARWTYEDGQVVDESTQTIAPTGDAVTEFHISKPGGLPKGKYKVEVFVNGTSADSEEFTVN